ncbi:MAG: hypothetical protein ACI82E_000817, partial [Nonlabens sp.]
VGAAFNFGGTEKVRFRTERKSKKQKYKIQEVDNILFTVTFKERVNGERIEKTEVKTYVPVLIRKSKRNDYLGFMQEVVVGGVSLYGRTVTQNNGSFMVGTGGSIAAPIYIGNWSEHNQLWVCREGEEAELINHVSLFKGFKKRAAEYFEDCPSLTAKLEGRGLKKSDLKEIVEFYNANCG